MGTKNAARPLRIGLTGGIASGKSLVADAFAALGVPVIDTDLIARDVVQPGKPALAEIHTQFGNGVIRTDGSLDRRALRRIVFADDEKRRQLESILHPRIREQTMADAAAVTAPYMVIVVPLLVESPMKGFMDRILVVDCSEATQISRLLRRDAESADQARRMIGAQASRAARLALADDVIDNDGDKRAAIEQAKALHDRYLHLTANSDS